LNKLPEAWISAPAFFTGSPNGLYSSLRALAASSYYSQKQKTTTRNKKTFLQSTLNDHLPIPILIVPHDPTK
jgi:hypothetical protein